MAVVVEGIETNEQLELVSVDGTVTEAQGYLFSRPVSAAGIRQLLDASHGRRLCDGSVKVACRSLRFLPREHAIFELRSSHPSWERTSRPVCEIM
jgi:hypothetical protein